MSEPIDEFDLPKLGEALRGAYTHRVAVPVSLDEAIRAAAIERMGRARRLRLLARWGTGLAAGMAAAIALVVWIHRPTPLGPVGFDRQMTMVDALNLARQVAAKGAIDKSWDRNGDGVIDQKDVDAVAALSVSLKRGELGQHPLPTLQQLGIANPANLASASGKTGETKTVALAHPKSGEVRR